MLVMMVRTSEGTGGSFLTMRHFGTKQAVVFHACSHLPQFPTTVLAQLYNPVYPEPLLCSHMLNKNRDVETYYRYHYVHAVANGYYLLVQKRSSMLSPYWKFDGCSSGKEVPWLLCSLKLHCWAYEGPSLNTLSAPTNTLNVPFLEDVSICGGTELKRFYSSSV
jgi:hypothetical protein